MAITINGDGSITGISAGGLPDGCVATDDLANNAVTAGKLATTLDLSSNTVTLPSGTGGKILQVKQTLKKTVVSVSNANPSSPQAVSGWSVAITPASTNSKILIMIYSSVTLTNTNGAACARLYRNGSVLSDSLATGGTTANHSFIASISPSTNQVANISGFYLDSPASTSEQTYQIYMTSNQGNINYTLGNAGGSGTTHVAPLSITAIEVSS